MAQIILLPLEEVEDTEEITELMEEIVGDIMALLVPVHMGCHKVAVMECIDEKQTKRFREMPFVKNRVPNNVVAAVVVVAAAKNETFIYIIKRIKQYGLRIK